jgi:hypothetical protein
MATATSCSDHASGGPGNKKPAAKTTPAPVAQPATVTARVDSTTTPTPTRTLRSKPASVNGPLNAPFTQSTLSGVYTAGDAREGRDLYLGYCVSCHTAATHTGPAFRLKWAGRPLSDLFSYMHTNMPKNDPASLDDYQYGVLLAYILQMNKMPAGKTALSPDSADLAKIRIDTIRTRKP